MPKTIIVSNRLPLSTHKTNDNLEFKSSAGGLVTGLSSVFSEKNTIWIGWPGIFPENDSEKQWIDSNLGKKKMVPVYMTEDEMNGFYEGMSNDTLWPLFHYFVKMTSFSENNWNSYVQVNRYFADVVLAQVEKDDVVWIHDYHLFLLPDLIRERFPDVSIGFFLHIPFPSYEVFRLLPWREKILKGVTGADLIGFHTYDDMRHFLSSVNRLLGISNDNGNMKIEARTIKIDAIPMGIDYNKFANLAISSKIQHKIDDIKQKIGHMKLIFSVDRLDISKGIPEKLRSYELFLEKYPEYREKCCLILFVVPSRTGVKNYQQLKDEIEREVGRINGKFGKLEWMPVYYNYRSIPNDYLTALYKISDIAMVTPLRDGMNLVAKEYIASQTHKTGVLILSELAGAAKELSDAILINPYNHDYVAEAIKTAIEMPEEEQKSRMSIMQNRLIRNDVNKWSSSFMSKLKETKEKQMIKTNNAVEITNIKKIASEWKTHPRKIIFLDYDGTLVGFVDRPQMARPDSELIHILQQLAENTNTLVVLITGRNKNIMTEWFGHLKNIAIVAEHGVWQKLPGEEWKINISTETLWKQEILPVFQGFTDSTPGTHIEEKDYTIVWHYRRADPDFGLMRARDLVSSLEYFVRNKELQVLEGKKVVELKPTSINKGIAALNIIKNIEHDLVIAIGDDQTDEDMFRVLPESNSDFIGIKVGEENTHAAYYLQTYNDVRLLLTHLHT